MTRSVELFAGQHYEGHDGSPKLPASRSIQTTRSTSGFLGNTESHDRSSRRRSLMELLAGYGLILLVIWTPRPWQQMVYLIAAVYLTTMTWLAYRGLGAMGIRTAGLLRSSWIVAVAGVLAAATVLWAYRWHGLHLVGGPMDFVRRYWGYAVWAFLQQVLLQDFFLRRLLCLIPGRPVLAVGAAAGIFAFAHLPNPILAPVTLLWGFAACLLFLRYRNLWPLAVVHALFGIVLSVAMPPTVIRGMRVGLGYVRHQVHRPVWVAERHEPMLYRQAE